jgi:hypothetical protein
MEMVKRVLAENGTLFLTVPVGPDVTVWNLHRRYGPVRLPKLLHGWCTVHRLPWHNSKLTESADWRRTYEPVFVLRKQSYCETCDAREPPK